MTGMSLKEQLRTDLTAQCRRCPVLWACNGGCPKDRFDLSDDGEPGQNHLCAGYRTFFTHAAPTIEDMYNIWACSPTSVPAGCCSAPATG